MKIRRIEGPLYPEDAKEFNKQMKEKYLELEAIHFKNGYSQDAVKKVQKKMQKFENDLKNKFIFEAEMIQLPRDKEEAKELVENFESALWIDIDDKLDEAVILLAPVPQEKLKPRPVKNGFKSIQK